MRRDQKYSFYCSIGYITLIEHDYCCSSSICRAARAVDGVCAANVNVSATPESAEASAALSIVYIDYASETWFS